jgi:hypothetical protein
MIAHMRVRLYTGIEHVEERDCPTRRCWCEIEELRAAAAGDYERAARFASEARYADEDGLSVREIVARIPYRPGKDEMRQAVANAREGVQW